MHDVLLIEDDPGQARLAQRALERAGYGATWVATAADGLDWVRQHAPAIAVLDRGLPDGDGLDVLRTIRHEAPHVCVIMLTGVDDVAVAVEAMRLGAWDYILKRTDLSHLGDLPLVVARNCERIRLLAEHERLNEAVRQSEQRYRELFNQASDVVVICDTAGVIQEANQAFSDLTGCAIADICGHPLGDFIPPTSPTTAPALYERSVRASADIVSEIHVRGRNGEEKWLDMKTRPLWSADGPRGFQGIGRDVTERRRTEQMKADFLAMVTHDMKNPVDVIAGYSEILLNDVSPGSVWRDMLLSIDASARGLLHLILNFLDLSRIESRVLNPVRVPTDIDAVLRQVIAYEAPLVRAKRIAIEVDLNAGAEIHVDPVQMDRALVNLVGNAIKFTPPEGQVRVSSARSDGRLEIRVSDTGPGIPSDQIPQLFGKYQRLSQTAQTGGTGLGLFIAKSLIEAHDGSVHVESRPGQGATFIVRLGTNGSHALE